MNAYHPADLAELKRMMSNLIRQGTIYRVNDDRVKVRSGELITNWLPWFTQRAGKCKTWWQPSIGEQVFILSPNGNLELGCVLPSLYCNDYSAPSASRNGHFVEFSDGATFEYDPDAHKLTINGIKTAVIHAEEQITAKAGTQIVLDTPLVQCTNHITFLSFSATGGASSGKSNKITGEITHDGGRLSSNGVVLHTHTHSGVESGNHSTGGPK